MQNVPEKLRSWRQSHGLSLVQAAALLGCSGPHVCDMEKGKKRPGRALAAQIHRETGISPAEWDGGEPEPVDAQAAVLAQLEALPETERRVALEVLADVVDGLRVGLARYGALDLERDERDFASELREELRDGLVYSVLARWQREGR